MNPIECKTPTSKDERILSCLILAQLAGIGSQRIIKLLETFGSIDNIRHAKEYELCEISRIGQSLAKEIKSALQSSAKYEALIGEAKTQLERAQKLGASVVTYWDEKYPALLKEIYDSPAFLFVRGEQRVLQNKSIAIVGTRLNSEYGKQVTRRLCEGLADAGITIVSGLAYGIDSIAHKTAIEKQSPTIAVLAGGVDYIYTDPKGHIYPKIIENGALISEEFIGTKATSDKFPKRNRIISGLCLGTLIIESDINGGALITASYALDQNRDVFAVPGNIFSKKSHGTNQLIRDGRAKLVLSADDLLNELQTPIRPDQTAKNDDNLSLFSDLSELTKEEQAILSCLNHQPVHIDELAIRCEIEISDLLAMLFELELKGIIEQLPGKLFQRKLK